MRRDLRPIGLLLEGLALGWVLACGQIEGPPGEGTGGTTSGGGTTSTGGAVAGGSTSGGATGIGTGGGLVVEGTGGYGGTGLEACGAPAGIFEPPCTESDLYIDAGCSWAPGIAFQYPATDLAAPTSAELRLVLLPKDTSGGFGGEGSGPLPYFLPVMILPSTAGTVTDTGFSLTSEATSLSATLPNPSDQPDYFTEVANPEPGHYPYHQGQLAVVDGSTILSQKRVLVAPLYVCLIK